MPIYGAPTSVRNAQIHMTASEFEAIMSTADLRHPLIPAQGENKLIVPIAATLFVRPGDGSGALTTQDLAIVYDSDPTNYAVPMSNGLLLMTGTPNDVNIDNTSIYSFRQGQNPQTGIGYDFTNQGIGLVAATTNDIGVGAAIVFLTYTVLTIPPPID